MTNIDIFKQQIQEMMNTDYRSFIVALINIERGETNKDNLQAIYNLYMENDDVTLLNQLFYK
ncbi:hypothetical protein [Veillonella sp. CHU740]|uniref:hypothetical protein n=1 Tax=Veillonella sp. CHU740 TaxID=2490950 RepID=UPI000F8D2E66|nr:hypothetical protein [Veillonella sp. CHU740]